MEEIDEWEVFGSDDDDYSEFSGDDDKEEFEQMGLKDLRLMVEENRNYLNSLKNNRKQLEEIRQNTRKNETKAPNVFQPSSLSNSTSKSDSNVESKNQKSKYQYQYHYQNSHLTYAAHDIAFYLTKMWLSNTSSTICTSTATINDTISISHKNNCYNMSMGSTGLSTKYFGISESEFLLSSREVSALDNHNNQNELTPSSYLILHLQKEKRRLMDILSKRMSERGVNVCKLPLTTTTSTNDTDTSFEKNTSTPSINFQQHMRKQNFVKIFDASAIVEFEPSTISFLSNKLIHDSSKADTFSKATANNTNNDKNDNQQDRNHNLIDDLKLYSSSKLRRSVVPGGYALLCLFSPTQEEEKQQQQLLHNHNKKPIKPILSSSFMRQLLIRHGFHPSIWDVSNASLLHGINIPANIITLTILSVQKRPCTINEMSCEWKENESFHRLSHENEHRNKDWLVYEQDILKEVTIPLSAFERIPKHYNNYHDDSMHDNSDDDIDQGDKYYCDNDNFNQSSLTNEAQMRLLHPNSIRKATHAISTYGFCIIRDLYDSQIVLPWANAACNDLSQAIDILKASKPSYNLLHPPSIRSATNTCETPANVSFKELAMREDLRVDLRDGPSIRIQRQKQEYQKQHQKNQNQKHYDKMSIETHPSITQIVTNTFHPTRVRGYQFKQNNNDHERNSNYGQPELYRGNFGLWNFNGSGPDAPPPPPKAHPIGFVISMPGCECQAIHTDTPHLFEHVDNIPPHYINLFVWGREQDHDNFHFSTNNNENDYDEDEIDNDGEYTGNTVVGGTAFVVGSHRLSTCAMLTTNNTPSSMTNNRATSTDVGFDTKSNSSQKQRDEMYKRIIRPSLGVGDALLFDCRILHFGTANRSKRKDGDIRGWRPLLYANLTAPWFSDPKNWDDKLCLFPTDKE